MSQKTSKINLPVKRSGGTTVVLTLLKQYFTEEQKEYLFKKANGKYPTKIVPVTFHWDELQEEDDQN